MSRDLVTVNCDLNLEGIADLIRSEESRIMKLVAAVIQTNRGLLFMNDGAYNGHSAWKPPRYRDGQPLQDTGALRNSIAPKIADPSVPAEPGTGGYLRYSGNISTFTVTVGTELIYANIHDKGGVIRPRNKKYLRFPRYDGKGYVFMKSVTIPQRNFTEWNDQDDQELGVTLVNFVSTMLQREFDGHR